MIKLRKIVSTPFGAMLTFDYDFEGKILSFTIDERDLNEKLKALRELLGRDLTIQDLKDVTRNIIDQIRKGEMPFPQKFDYNSLINVDLEV